MIPPSVEAVKMRQWHPLSAFASRTFMSREPSESCASWVLAMDVAGSKMHSHCLAHCASRGTLRMIGRQGDGPLRGDVYRCHYPLPVRCPLAV